MFVLDCSVTMAWCFEDQASDYADAVLACLETKMAVVPPLWHLEVLNVLLIGERRKRITSEQSSDFLGLLYGLSSIDTDLAHTSIADTQVLDLARQHQLSIYDTSYLAIAVTGNIPIATQDKKLKMAAQSCGLLFVPPFS